MLNRFHRRKFLKDYLQFTRFCLGVQLLLLLLCFCLNALLLILVEITWYNKFTLIEIEKVFKVLKHLRVKFAFKILVAPVFILSLIALMVIFIHENIEIHILILINLWQCLRHLPLLQTFQSIFFVFKVNKGIFSLDRRVIRRFYDTRRSLAITREYLL